ncbi:MAG: DUF4149 domain-containing protein [Leptospirillia bacterium]
MPNLTFMGVQFVYMLALVIWVGGMIGFIVLFVPSMSAVLERHVTGQVITNFLPRLKKVVAICIVLLAVTSAVKLVLWENITPWLIGRWAALAAMFALAVYDYAIVNPRMTAAKAAGDIKTFDELHGKAIVAMGATLLMGLVALFLS